MGQGALSAHKYQDLELYDPIQLVAPQAVPQAIAQVYPVAPNLTTVRVAMRKVYVSNNTGGALNFSLRQRPASSAGTSATDIISVESVGANGHLYIDFGKDGFVIPAGNCLWALASGAGLQMSISGAQEYLK